MPEGEDVKKRIASASGVNPKTIERSTRILLENLFGITEEDLKKDPALRAYIRYILFGEDPSPYVKLEKKSESDDSKE